MKYYCNPLNMEYRYQFNTVGENQLQIAREAADPSMICFQGKYYLFASMTLEVWVSEDMVEWKSYRLPDNLPLYDYAPDVRVLNGYVYFSASKRGEISDFYRTKDVINGPYEKIAGTFEFWDPNLFVDDDKKVYFYWGCTNTEPVYGVELNPEDMKPISEKRALIYDNMEEKGYERSGEDHSEQPLTGEVHKQFQVFPGSRPFIEGAWMDKYKGKYYLQYAAPGTEYNIYLDGVYVGEHPLGPFELAPNNPYSYKPGGFIPGAGHGSSMWDMDGNFWHTSTMRISTNHIFERRVGLWPAGFDKDGELFCDQRYGDWPMKVEPGKREVFAQPEWYLLSYGANMSASSVATEHEPEKAADENVQTWWKAKGQKSGEWLAMDLGESCMIHAVQINFADDKPTTKLPEGAVKQTAITPRYIDERTHCTRWKLEASVDGEEYFMVEDKSQVETNLPHDLIVKEAGVSARYLKLTIYEVPFQEAACISGLRVFGKAVGEKPAVPAFNVVRNGDLDMTVTIGETAAMGYNILWGHEAEKLYHSYMVFGKQKTIGALVKGMDYYVRVDAFNKSGITEGIVTKV